MRIAIFPGSFDPITLGHVDLIRRGTALCDQLIVAVLVNPDKRAYFTQEERIRMISQAVRDVPGVTVEAFSGLLAEFADMRGASFILRGIRGQMDLIYETDMAWANEQLLSGLETVFLPARPELAPISSSMVRQIAAFGGDISPFVPASAVDEITHRFYNGERKAIKGGIPDAEK